MEQRKINPWAWQDQFAFSQAIEVTGAKHLFFCAGQTSIDEQGHPVHIGDMRAQIELALKNLETVLQSGGISLSNVARLNYYTTDVESFLAAYDVVTSHLAKASCQPASTLLGVTRLAFPELLVEIEATAVR